MRWHTWSERLPQLRQQIKESGVEPDDNWLGYAT